MQAVDIIVKDPGILGGTHVFRGTRIPFQALLDYLEGGETLDELWTISPLSHATRRLQRSN